MKILIFGAGPLGSLYAYRFAQAGLDITLLDQGARRERLASQGLELFDEMLQKPEQSSIRVISALTADADYDLVLVLVRKNRLPPVFETLAQRPQLRDILFMGNNALGFGAYLDALPHEKLLFGFPNAGGGLTDHVVHYADRETPRGLRKPVILGEIDGSRSERLLAVKGLFEQARIPVEITDDIDGWLKYHLALVLPLVLGLYCHDCDCEALANDKPLLETLVRAVREAGRVIGQLGHRRQPFKFNLFYWLPAAMHVKVLQGLLRSRFAEIAFAAHARSARDEMAALDDEFQALIESTGISTPKLDSLRRAANRAAGPSS